jgi:hypothetical protein
MTPSKTSSEKIFLESTVTIYYNVLVVFFLNFHIFNNKILFKSIIRYFFFCFFFSFYLTNIQGDPFFFNALATLFLVRFQ